MEETQHESLFAPIADVIALLCALGILFDFLLLPWVGAGALELIQVQEGETSLFLVLAGALTASVGALWALRVRAFSRAAAGLMLLGGLLGMVYYAGFFLSMQPAFRAGLGFWLALLANALLVVQVFVPRPPLPEHATSEANYLGIFQGTGAYFIEQAAARIGAMPLYLAVFANLALITLVEVILTDIPGDMTLPLVALSALKVALVAMYYMHLKRDHWLFSAIVLIPLPFIFFLLFALRFGL